jgi:integrase
MIALNTGRRKGEVLGLTRARVDFVRDIIHLPRGKNGRVKRVKMNQVLKAYLLDLKPNGPYWVNIDGERIHDIRHSFKNMLVALNIYRPGLRPHCTRHTFATKAREEGCDLLTLKTLLGVSSVEMVERYAEISNKSLTKAVESASFDLPEPAPRRKQQNNNKI